MDIRAITSWMTYIYTICMNASQTWLNDCLILRLLILMPVATCVFYGIKILSQMVSHLLSVDCSTNESERQIAEEEKEKLGRNLKSRAIWRLLQDSIISNHWCNTTTMTRAKWKRDLFLCTAYPHHPTLFFLQILSYFLCRFFCC